MCTRFNLLACGLPTIQPSPNALSPTMRMAPPSITNDGSFPIWWPCLRHLRRPSYTLVLPHHSALHWALGRHASRPPGSAFIPARRSPVP